LAAKIEGLRSSKIDFIQPTEALTMQVLREREVPMMALEIPGERGGWFPVLEDAHNQIGERLGIPGRYYDFLRRELPDVLAVNVNAGFRHKSEPRMLRTQEGNLRSFHSNRYQRIEHEEIAEVALPILLDTPGIQVRSCEITSRRMYIQATTALVRGEPKVGDVMEAGVLISNSETGHGAVNVSPLCFRLSCLNGAVHNDGRLRGYHVGGRVESSEDLWADDTRQADDRAILLKVRDTVRAALDAAAFSARIEKMKALADGRVTGDPVKAVGVLAAKIGATDTERGSILSALISGGDISAWGLVNAVTAQAHTVASYDRGVEFERMGGSLIDLDPSAWREVLEAA
jgi:hypothetical protein